MPKPRIICLIPARGGSKRLPRKNALDFLGRPIIAYTIDAALGCGELFSKIVVSTEDEEIAEIGRNCGAEIAARPLHLASDTAQVVDVAIELLDREAQNGNDYDVLCCLYPTSPLRNAADIRQTVALIEPGVCDFSMAITHYDLPVRAALRQTDDGLLAPMWPKFINKRSQEVPQVFCNNGSTYAVSVSAFQQSRSFHGPKLRGYFMPRNRSVDIDLPDDLDLALHYARKLWNR